MTTAGDGAASADWSLLCQQLQFAGVPHGGNVEYFDNEEGEEIGAVQCRKDRRGGAESGLALSADEEEDCRSGSSDDGNSRSSCCSSTAWPAEHRREWQCTAGTDFKIWAGLLVSKKRISKNLEIYFLRQKFLEKS